MMPDWSLWQWIIAIAVVWMSLGMILALGLICGVQSYIQQTCRELGWKLDSCERELGQIKSRVASIEDDVSGACQRV
jgi:hypothetical protein